MYNSACTTRVGLILVITSILTQKVLVIVVGLLIPLVLSVSGAFSVVLPYFPTAATSHGMSPWRRRPI